MTDDPSQDPQREVERLAAELARRERENDELKQELARTKNVQDDLWSHDIYLKARRKMLGGVIAVLGVLSAFGLVTVYELYQSGLDYVGDEMKVYVKGEVKTSMGSLIQAEGPKMIEEAKGRMNARVDEHIDAFIEELDKETSSVIAAKKTEIEKEIAQLKEALKKERIALTEQARQTRLGMTGPAKAESVDTEILQSSADCDPNYLDDAQIARVGVRQLSEGTGKIVRNGREVFENTFFLDVRETDETTGAAEAMCILYAVDRVVYGADPRWYKPAEFVCIDRENEYRFTISGWGPTGISAQVYFIGRRDPLRIQGNLTMTKVTRADKRYLGEAPPGDL